MPDTFDNGLTAAEYDLIDDLDIGIAKLKFAIKDELPRHRSLALAVTKLEEAQHWLRDRKKKPANE